MGRPRRVELSVPPEVYADEAALARVAAKRAGVRARDVRAVRILRRAIDARRGRVRVVLRAEVHTSDPPSRTVPSPRALPALSGAPAVAIVGAGPAGLFCALELASAGVRSVLVERGHDVRTRRRHVADLSARGRLHEDSNYCFGEGGAGTFSDGKLYTRSKKRGAVEVVLRDLVAYGAPSRILIDSRPHVGTNRLPTVVAALRAHLRSAGVEILFGRRATALAAAGGRVRGVVLDDGTRLAAPCVVLATGHSARDVYRFVAAAGGVLKPKPFAAGVRIEVSQARLDRQQYGRYAGHPALGAASVRLVVPLGEGRSAYTFCMCPGGHIAPATTDPDAVVVNGWSPSARRGRFANSGFVVPVGPSDLAAVGLDPSRPLDWVAFQARLEQAAFAAGGGAFTAPAARAADFVAGRVSSDLPPASYPRGLRPADLDAVLGPLAAPLRRAFTDLAGSLPLFADDQAVLVGVESRTSAPVRIPRDPRTRQHPALPGLYPVGEGAGYAGGIVSAALDGIATARAIAGCGPA